MPDELEQRLSRLLGRLRGPSDEAKEGALASALAAVPEPPPVRARPARTLLLAAAAAVVLLGIAAGALAAAGALHVSIGTPAKRPAQAVARAASRLRLPAGAAGIAAVVDGRLWLTTRGGVRIEGLPVDSATLSPHALYVAAGIGTSLVAMAPDGTRAWSHPAGGAVVAIAWAPDGLRIAYVVQRRGRFELRTIEGNGSHDRLLDRAVRPLAPSWRSDSLAVAYLGAGGRPVVYDFAHDAHRLVPGSGSGAGRLAFGPTGAALALASAHQLRFVSAGGRAEVTAFGRSSVAGLAWLDGGVVVAVDPPSGAGSPSTVELLRQTSGPAPAPVGELQVPGRIAALDASGGRLVIAVEAARVPTRVLTMSAALQAQRAVLELPSGSRVDALSIR